ncbi:hypothetical protein ACI2OX_15200 [Bacillus sp. N9]
MGRAFIDEEGDRLTFEEKQEVIKQVENELLAYGPITPLLENPSISEVMVNGPDAVYYEKTVESSKVKLRFVTTYMY